MRTGRIRVLAAAALAAALVLAHMTSVLPPAGMDTFYAEAAVEPTLTAKAAALYCENTGEMIFTKDEDRKLYPYSVTKLMTALVTVMNTPLDKKVKVSERAAGQAGTEIGLIAGETVTVEQLLYGALLESGNDAAYALAEAGAKDADRFIKKMNRTAKNIGCKNTHFANPTGLDDTSNYTTASDLILISRVAFDNETIKEITGSDSYLMKPTDKSGIRRFGTHIKDLYEKGTITAGKTGSNGSEFTLSCKYEKNGLRLFAVILGDTEEGRESDLSGMIRYGESIVEGVSCVKAGVESGSVRIKHGAKTKLPVYTAEEGRAYIPSEGSKDLITTETKIFDDVEAPVKAGREVGVLSIFVGGEKVNDVPLVIKEDVEVGWPTSYLGIPNSVALVIGIILGVIILAAIVIMILRIYFKIKYRRARKKRIAEMAKRELEEEEERRKRGWDM